MNFHSPPHNATRGKAADRRQAQRDVDIGRNHDETSNILIFPLPGFGPCQSVANLIGMALAARTESNFGRHAYKIDERTAIILRKLQTSALDGDPAAKLVFEHLQRQIQRRSTNCR